MKGTAGAHGSEAVREKREGSHVGQTSKQVKWYDRNCRECHNFGGGGVGNGENGIYGICVCIMGDQNNLQATLALFSKPCALQTCTIIRWDFELRLASKVNRWTSQEDRNNGRDFLPCTCPAPMVEGSMRPTLICWTVPGCFLPSANFYTSSGMCLKNPKSLSTGSGNCAACDKSDLS